jgi:hypothetical protein
VDVLSRPDISLADRALGQGQPAAVTNIDQRVGVLAHTVTNHGALQVGDNNTQTVTLTREQSSQLLSQLPELRELISAVNLPREISDRLESDIHELEQVAEHGVGWARALLGDMVEASAVAASTDAGQRLGALLFSLMGGLA